MDFDTTALFDLFSLNNNTRLNFMDSSIAPKVSIVERPSLIKDVPDTIFALVLPIVMYWLISTFFLIVDTYELSEKYRIHTPEEVISRNKASLHDVLLDVALQHLIQTLVGLIEFFFEPVPTTGFEDYALWQWRQSLPKFVPNNVIYYGYWYGFSLIKLAVATLIIDSWQYWLHRLMHINPYLYKHYHSRHHKLYVPYAFGALYNAPLEGFLLDTTGTGLAMLLTGLTPRESIVLYTFSTMKTVDDHCGYAFPWDPFQYFFPNNSIYHDIHHQSFGVKTNFSQPFYIFWDKLNGTVYPDLDKYKENQKRISLAKYKMLLSDRRKRALRRGQYTNTKENSEVAESKMETGLKQD